jgi:hypothetical protein
MLNDTASDSPVPIVDYGLFLHGGDEDKRKVAAQIDEAFRTVGFVCLVNHGIEQAKVDECFEWVSGNSTSLCLFISYRALPTPFLSTQAVPYLTSSHSNPSANSPRNSLPSLLRPSSSLLILPAAPTIADIPVFRKRRSARTSSTPMTSPSSAPSRTSKRVTSQEM